MMDDLMIKVDHISKRYRLGQIGGTTLREELQRKFAKLRGREDPTAKIGMKGHMPGETFLALDDVSFEVKKGERIGIIGQNGAGKSTLLKVISRVTAPTSGSIGLNGRITSMLEVGTGFHGELTGRENIYMNGAILGMTRAEIDKKIEDIIEFSEVREFIDTPVKRYSSGMYVKLAFSVAAHLDSEIMIMDEVLAVGDMAFQKKCLNKMKETAEKEGRTILYVSHNMNTIRQLCERCIVLDHGRIVFQGDVEEAIGIYLHNEAKELGVDIDLTHNRMDHLPKKVIGKITHLTLPGKQEAVFHFDEIMKMKLNVRACEKLTDLSLRFEIRSMSGYSVGVALISDFASIEAEETKSFTFDVDIRGLVAGEYVVCLVLYEANEGGSFVDIDAIYPALIFEVRDIEGKMQLEWRPSQWGYVKFPDLTLTDSEKDR